MDEIQDLLSDKRILFILNSNLNNVKLLALTATLDRKRKYIVQDEEITKYQLLNRFCPIIYSYTINEAIDDKNTRELKFFILKHSLDIRKNIKAKGKNKEWMTSEQLQYEYLDKAFKKAIFMPDSKSKDKYVRMCAANRARFLYSLPSKTELVKTLVSKLEGKTLIFGLDNKSLIEICPNAIVETNKNLSKDLEDFKLGKTQITASNKILRQGENIPNLSNIIFHSYYSAWPVFTQMLGRSRKSNSVGYVILVLTENTQEQKWFEAATENLKSSWIYCTSINQLIERL